MCLIVGRAYGIPTVALRLFNVFGTRQSLSNPYTGVLAIFASRILNGNAPLIFEDGLQRRDFASVYDVVPRSARLRPGVAHQRRIRARAGAPGFRLPRHHQTIWDGRELRGRRVLVRCYHGLGDTIQFIRYVPLLRGVARQVIVWAQPRLLSILGTVEGVDRLLPLHDGIPEVDYDVDVEVMELPYIFRTTLSSIPNRVPYLDARPAPALAGTGPHVGLVWRGGTWDDTRALPFDCVVSLVERTPVSWHALQYPVWGSEHHDNLRALDCGTIESTASWMRRLDLIVTVDSMAAHLAGALGARVWTLLAADADWRWMRGRRDSPWYPTMRLFRQPAPGDWASVVDEVSRAMLRL
jgi:hypothetical protein